MKRSTILNEGVNTAIAGIGHLDTLGIVDAGYPIPLGVTRVDLALREGMPAFMDVLNTILEDFIVESFIIAQETIENSPRRVDQIRKALPGCPEEAVPHTEFKERMLQAKAVIRSGEFTPYSNVILVSGVDLPRWFKE